ncbi:MAG TPA: hypothetical protein VI454_08365 [Verrucomicrobiae bacterium]
MNALITPSSTSAPAPPPHPTTPAGPPLAESPDAAAPTQGPARIDKRPPPYGSPDFREEILKRYEAPFWLGWPHGGLNE